MSEADQTPKSTKRSASARGMSSLETIRRSLGAYLGMSFRGRRNLYETFGYTATPTFAQLREKYVRQDIVSRIVNAYPDAVWTRPPEVINNDTLSEALDLLNDKVSLWHYINRADRLSGIGKYSVLFLGFSDADSDAKLSTEVRAGGSKPVTLEYVQVYGHSSVKINSYEENPTSPYFGMPKIYELSLPSEINVKNRTITAHRSRILHIADCMLDSDIEGVPILERVNNRLDDIEKVVGGSAEMFWLNGRGGLHVDVDKDTEFTVADGAKLKENIDEYVHDMQRVIRTRGVQVKNLGGQSVNPEPVFNVIMSIISTTTGIPQRIFIGSEQGKLASEQDRANWALRIDERRKLFAEPKILLPLITRLQNIGALPKGAFVLQWPEAFRMSPLERAQTAAQQARAATNVVRAIQDSKKPIEGVDYSIRRPTAQMAGGGGGFGKGLASITHLADVPKPEDKKPMDDKAKKPNDAKSGADPKNEAPKPVPLPMEEITIKPVEILSRDEARAIIFARGELKTEGNIDGVMD